VKEAWLVFFLPTGERREVLLVRAPEGLFEVLLLTVTRWVTPPEGWRLMIREAGSRGYNGGPPIVVDEPLLPRDASELC